MKRRNAECGKLRRPIKRNKITENMYNSTIVLYMKFLVLWAIVITADFMFMFRFEFLWPFWLLLRSVYDSFKYKGVGFSILFFCIAITSDVVCIFFIPVNWLLFAASTYVWVQYVWHTDKGICLPTILMWMLFVYFEAGIRWKDSRHMPHLNLCRPFAAHCIGYPVVTLGFGFKSYVGYRMRQRTQREVAKQNLKYIKILEDALPVQEPTPSDDIQAIVATNTTNANAVAATASSHGSVAAGGSGGTQNQHNHIGNSSLITTAASLTAAHTQISNSIATANGVVALAQNQQQQQQHQSHHQHNHHQQQEQHHLHSNNHNGNSFTTNNAASTASSATLPGVANTNSSSSSNITSSSTSNNNNNNATSMSASYLTSTLTTTSTSSSSLNDDKSYVQIGGGSGVSSNGHIGGGGSLAGNKSHRRSMDKENKHKGGLSSNHNNLSSAGGDSEIHIKTNNKNSNNYHQLNQSNESNTNHLHNHHQQQQQQQNHNYNNKEKSPECNNNYHQQQQKDKHDSQTKSTKKSNTSTASSLYNNVNGNVNLQMNTDDIVTVEPVEKTKGRRNRPKKDNASKDNHHHNNSSSCSSHNNSNNHSHTKDSSSKENHNTTKDTHHNHHHNSDASSVSSSSSSTSSSSSSGVSGNSATSTISHLASKVVSKICESCLKLEADVKKYRAEISHMKQIENELRQKLDTNITTKSCLQAKQKECDELEKRLHELTNARHNDAIQLQTVERRLVEERRQKQSLDAQLSNEKKARKLAEEKASRPDCSSQCKQRKQQMDEEMKQLRRDIKMAEDAKQMAEQHGRKWEQELRMFEQEIRNRDSIKPGTDVLMNALVALQEKFSNLEKNLSAETRVKLDLFSALGDAKRQLEITESLRRSKEDEVHDLKAKIAQLLAVMPTDTLCLPACSSTGASSMLRMNDTPPLQTGPGPASPMLTSLSAAQAQQLTGRVIVSTSTSDYVQQTISGDYVVATHSQQQQQQQHQQTQNCAGVVPVSVANSVLVTCPQVSNGVGNANGSILDPNATVYTPKSGPNNNGVNVVVVGGSTDA